MIDYKLYYDWPKLMSYGAFISMIIGGRNIGKTYGLRYEFFKDFIKTGNRFVEICRFDNEITAVGSGYFEKLVANGDLQYKGKQYVYKYTKRQIYIAAIEPDKPIEKYKWELAGYLVALSAMQKTKKQTFAKVRNIVMDEAIIDSDLSPYNHYLRNEYIILINILSSVIRETPGEKTNARVFLLGNAVDPLNPYFQAFGLDDLPAYGYHWALKKRVLIHMIEDTKLSSRVKESVIASLLENTLEYDTMFKNKFRHSEKDNIRKKTPVARFTLSVSYKGFEFGVWTDRNEGIFITSKIPIDNQRQYIITFDDFKNAGYLDKKYYVIHMLDYWYRQHQIYYETTIIKGKFLEMLKELEGYK